MAWLRFFFFSSRRRHTRCLSDWSSDVCSSDLPWRSITASAAGSPASANSHNRFMVSSPSPGWSGAMWVCAQANMAGPLARIDRKSTRLNSSHLGTSYAGFCLKKNRGSAAGRAVGVIGASLTVRGQPRCAVDRRAPTTRHRAGGLRVGGGYRCVFVFFNDTATTEIYPLSLHDALPISGTTLMRTDLDGAVMVDATPDRM